MPSTSQISKSVINSVSKYSGVKVDDVEKGMILSDPPLNYVSISYNSLTLSLRAFIQFHKPNNTILAKEVKKSDQTVGGLIALVTSRV